MSRRARHPDVRGCQLVAIAESPVLWCPDSSATITATSYQPLASAVPVVRTIAAPSSHHQECRRLGGVRRAQASSRRSFR